MRKQRLGEMLQQAGLVDDIQLRAALGFHYKWGVPLGQIVVDMKFCTAQQVLELLAGQLGLQAIDLDEVKLDTSLQELLPVETVEACRVVPLRVEGPRNSVLVVAAAAPASPSSLDEVARVAGKVRVVAMLATDAAVSRAIDRIYYPHLIGAKRPVEPIPLPEADANLPLVTDRAEMLALGETLQARRLSNPRATVQQDGLPLMMPLMANIPTYAHLNDPSLAETQKILLDVEIKPEVWVYGWGAKATEGLMKLLQNEGLRVKVARTEDVVLSTSREVVLAPLQSIESVMRHGIRAQILMAGRAHEKDKALALGAQGFLSGPLRTDHLIRELKLRIDAGRTPMRRAG
jgi:type II secretion system (T2SS) protein E